MSTVTATLKSELLERFYTESEGGLTMGPGAENEGDVIVGLGVSFLIEQITRPSLDD